MEVEPSRQAKWQQEQYLDYDVEQVESARSANEHATSDGAHRCTDIRWDQQQSGLFCGSSLDLEEDRGIEREYGEKDERDWQVGKHHGMIPRHRIAAGFQTNEEEDDSCE
ncbi:MAG: hypothetical protein Q9188_005158 [Gyalolechia gomerana]